MEKCLHYLEVYLRELQGWIVLKIYTNMLLFNFRFLDHDEIQTVWY